MASIPVFEPDGLLPSGDYEVSFEELRESILVLGPGDSANYPNWDRAWRLHLVDNLEILTRQLWQVGIREIYADGSFAEDKDHPNDIDGYFVCDLLQLSSGELTRQLNLIDPFESFHLQLKEEVESYEKLKRGEFDELDNLRGLGHLLISIRIAQGLSQRDLAKKLNVHESQVSRDERNEYFGITLERAIRLLDALNVKLRTQVEIVADREAAVA